MEQGILQARGLCKSYGSNQVLHDLDLDILPGKIYGLIGRNGAGKTTTMKMQASHSGNAIRKTFRMFSILFSSYFQLTHRLFAARVSICTQPAGRPAFTG